MTRALVLAGGGIRVAWQAGAVQALDEHGLRFAHGDGTSGGIFTLGALLSGVTPADLGRRWRELPVRRFVSLLPLRSYLRSPTAWPAFGGSGGIRRHVLPGLGVDLPAIRSGVAAGGMTGTFNVADFGAKRCVAIPQDEIDEDRLVAGVSLPIFLPAVAAGGRTWTDAVWAQDANLWECVRRGATELWVLWCIGNSSRFGEGPLEQYVHMIELAATSSLLQELDRIGELNERRAGGEAVLGSTAPVEVHVVSPVVPLPLDPDFVLGRIDAETLVAMGYRDAWAVLDAGAPAVRPGTDPTAKDVPTLGARATLRAELDLAGGTGRLFVAVEGTDVRRWAGEPGEPRPVVGALDHPAWGYRPFRRAEVRFADDPTTGRALLLDAALTDDAGAEVRLEARLPLGRRRQGWDAAGRLSVWVTADGRAEQGSGRLGRRDALRSLVSLEPTGAHGVRDRAAAILAAARLALGPSSKGRS